MKQGLLIICLVFAVIATAFLMHIHDLQARIVELEQEVSVVETKLAAYERTLCERPSVIRRSNMLTNYSLESAGHTRSYQVHTPPQYDASVRYPVIFSFDGIEGSGARMRGYSQLDALPVIVVYLDALKGKQDFTAWQGAPYSVEGDRDIRFVRQLLDVLPTQYCIDTTQVFAVGMSNGGSFANLVGCTFGDKIRAVATVSGAYYTSCPSEERTPSLLVLHSMHDGQVPFKGQQTRQLPNIQRWVEEKVEKRGCQVSVPPFTGDDTIYYNWTRCNDNSLLRLVIVQHQPHGWLAIPRNNTRGIATTADYIWRFFQDARYTDASDEK